MNYVRIVTDHTCGFDPQTVENMSFLAQFPDKIKCQPLPFDPTEAQIKLEQWSIRLLDQTGKRLTGEERALPFYILEDDSGMISWHASHPNTEDLYQALIANGIEVPEPLPVSER